MFLEDYGDPNDSVPMAAERQFKEHYLCHLGDGARFVRLESTFSGQLSMLCVNPS
jgi:hypothetical protein